MKQEGDEEDNPEDLPHEEIMRQSFEPGIIKENYLTNHDRDICLHDVPERLQLRGHLRPHLNTEGNRREFELEAKFMLHKHFRHSREDKTVLEERIVNVLTLMNQDLLEPPFIACYRKEEFEPELTEGDLWTIHHADAEWRRFYAKLQRIEQNYTLLPDYVTRPHERPKILPPLDRIRTESMADDVLSCISLKLPFELQRARDSSANLRRRARTREILPVDTKPELLDEFGDLLDDEDEGDDQVKKRESPDASPLGPDAPTHTPTSTPTPTRPRTPPQGSLSSDLELPSTMGKALHGVVRRSMYYVCKENKIDSFAEHFGLTSPLLGANLLANFMVHELRGTPGEKPLTLANSEEGEYLTPEFPQPEDVVRASVHYVAMEISYDPLVREVLRDLFFEASLMTTRPTAKGRQLDPQNRYAPLAYLTNKPISSFENQDLFLEIDKAEKEGFLTYEIHLREGTNPLLSAMKEFYLSSRSSDVARAWDELRTQALEEALNKHLIPLFRRELAEKLRRDAGMRVIRHCCNALETLLMNGPFVPPPPPDRHQTEVDPDEIKVLAISHTSPDVPTMCVLLDNLGEIVDHLRLTKMHMPVAADPHKADVEKLREFIVRYKPHVVAIGAHSLRCRLLYDEIIHLCADLETAPTRLVKGENGEPIALDTKPGFPSHSPDIKPAFLEADRQELSRLMSLDLDSDSSDDEDTAQRKRFDRDSKERIRERIVQAEEMMTPKLSHHVHVTYVSDEVAILYAGSSRAETEFRDYPLPLRQAISIGRRLLEPMAEICALFNPQKEILCMRLHSLQSDVDQDLLLQHLESVACHVVSHSGVDPNLCAAHHHLSAPLQFIAGFGPRKAKHVLTEIQKLGGSLDGRRRLITSHITMWNVFNNAAGFLRIRERGVLRNSPNVDVLDDTRVHPESYHLAKRMAQDALQADEEDFDEDEERRQIFVEEIMRSDSERLNYLDLDAFARVLEENGRGKKRSTLYDIRAEMQKPFKEYRHPYHDPTDNQLFYMLTNETEETLHDNTVTYAIVQRQANSGQGYTCRLESGISAYLPNFKISEDESQQPELELQSRILVVVKTINFSRFFVSLSMLDREIQYAQKEALDNYGRCPLPPEKIKAKEKKRPKFVHRIIQHPLFQNISSDDAVAQLEEKDVGEVIVRPSSRGSHNLTVSFKFHPGVICHIDIREEDKVNRLSLGRTLTIGGESFEDLDEIVVRHVEPIIALVKEMCDYEKFIEGPLQHLEEAIRAEKDSNPKRIPYAIGISHTHPGRFVWVYQPGSRPRHINISVTPEGYRFLGRTLSRPRDVVKYFKQRYEHIRKNPHLGQELDPRYNPQQQIHTHPHAHTQAQAPTPMGHPHEMYGGMHPMGGMMSGGEMLSPDGAGSPPHGYPAPMQAVSQHAYGSYSPSGPPMNMNGMPLPPYDMGASGPSPSHHGGHSHAHAHHGHGSPEYARDVRSPHGRSSSHGW
eukprot:gnl/Trimastix_PCT/2089.p1 GENE.gnl/Trimastix_PCT/2089~~gnl/Trimastix_PCT/2089.p1  ORF type:complete len:1618 (-),score=369.71 gnl/Trimastix_PCT/2089:90-4475(-)